MKFFVIVNRYVVEITRINELRPSHLEWVEQYYKNGNMILSGPQVPRSGGVMFVKAETRDFVENMVKQDPFYINKVSEYNIYEFLPNKSSAEFPEFAQYLVDFKP